jgi:uncharacterized protein YbjT (DUF2867 family)
MKHSQPVIGYRSYRLCEGGRLIPQPVLVALAIAGYKVRAMGRSLSKISCRPWARHPQVEIVEGDVLDLESMKKAARLLGGFLPGSFHDFKKSGFVDADRRGAKTWLLRHQKPV